MLPEPRHRARTRLSAWSTGPRRTAALLSVLALIVLGIVGGLTIGRMSDTPATAAEPGPAVLGPLTGPPTLYGRVRQVVDPATVVVEVQGRPVRVSVIGVDTSSTPACARAGAQQFAERFLGGQEVTLVPDPTLPATAADAPAWPAYLVVGTQQSYTDAALVAGWVDPGRGRYRPGFENGQRIAQEQRAGMWGPPCNRTS
ncbi:thermonuclease family protein [Pseudonocardia spirodelae]|uniref:TNase-like domain-containing protein n=1 Tax=Pseudonocardia spirodelae TaxID=3133431 RepID=A0ABU8TA68_9PSEU